MDWRHVVLPFVEEKFSFHLRDIDGQEGSSAGYWGRPILIYVIPSEIENQPYLTSFPQLKAVTDRYQSVGAGLLGILISTPKPDGSHIKKAKDFAKGHSLPGERIFIAHKQVQNQLRTRDARYPYFIFLGRDGKIEGPTWGWAKRMPLRAEEIMSQLVKAANPAGSPPKPPDLEEVKVAEPGKDAPRQGTPDRG